MELMRLISSQPSCAVYRCKQPSNNTFCTSRVQKATLVCGEVVWEQMPEAEALGDKIFASPILPRRIRAASSSTTSETTCRQRSF